MKNNGNEIFSGITLFKKAKSRVKMEIVNDMPVVNTDNPFISYVEYHILNMGAIALFSSLFISFVLLFIIINSGGCKSNSGYNDIIQIVYITIFFIVLLTIIYLCFYFSNGNDSILSSIYKNGIKIVSTKKKRGEFFIESTNISDIVVESSKIRNRGDVTIVYKIVVYCIEPMYLLQSKRIVKKFVLLYKAFSDAPYNINIHDRSIVSNPESIGRKLNSVVGKLKSILDVDVNYSK